MKIQQGDILGNSHEINLKKTNKEAKTTSSWKNFPKIDLSTGLNTLQLQADYMLILRMIQKRLANNKNIDKVFIKIFQNELYIKSGKRDIVSATRDSLLEYCLKSK